VSLRNELVKQCAEGLARDVDRLALDMILRGMFPSQGWRIGYTMELDGRQMKYTCFPVPPA
jgi:hypothetical protein